MRDLSGCFALLLITSLLAFNPGQAQDQDFPADQCFQVLYPEPGAPHELTEDEYDEIGVLFQINCDNSASFADRLEVQTSNGEIVHVPLDEWHTEMYQFEVLKPGRGVKNMEASLFRPTGEVENVSFTLQMTVLFDPVVKVVFPPPDFKFYQGVGPFYKLVIEESPTESYHYGPMRSFFLEERVDGPSLEEPVVRSMQKVTLAYLDAGLPDGPYNLTFTVLDDEKRRYSSASISIWKDSVNEYVSNVTGTDLTSCAKMLDQDCDRKCLRGYCHRGACLCEADWFGEHCDLDLHDDPAYLPEQNPAEALWSCHQAKHFRDGLIQFNDMLTASQFPDGDASCRDRGGLQAFHADTVSAFGINLRSLAIALGRSLQTLRPITVGSEWSCLKHERCSEGRYTCYFQPLTNCSEDGQIPSCGWKDDNQELDYPRPAFHPNELLIKSHVDQVLEANCKAGTDAVDALAAELLVDTGKGEVGGKVQNLGVAGNMAFKLQGGTRWLKHPMGTIRVLDLYRGQIVLDEPLALSRQYTVFAWLEWKPSDVAARTVVKTLGGSAIAVQEGSRLLGLYEMPNDTSEGANFASSGYQITVAGWQMIMAIGYTTSEGRNVTHFYVNNEFVGESTGHQGGQQLVGFGFTAQGPGFIAMAGLWQRALDVGERSSLWEATRGCYGLRSTHIANTHPPTYPQESSKSLKGQRNYTLSMTSTPLEFKLKGTQWWMSHALQFVMRPNEHLSRLIREAKRAVQFRDNMLGVHVRHGEACDIVNNRKCFEAEEILPSIQVMVKRYSLSGVYLATDSPSMLDKFRELDPTIRWACLEAFDRNQLNLGWTQMLMTRIGRIDRRVVAESSFIDIFLLSETEAMVGQFSSAFFRTAFALSVAEKGYIPPYLGLDGPPSW